MKSKGIKPIIGCEVYVAARSRFDKVHGIDSNRHHLVLLCKNETGYKNLIKLVSSAWVDGFYTKPRIDRELLEKHHEGLVCLSACVAGTIPQYLLQNQDEEAEKIGAKVYYPPIKLCTDNAAMIASAGYFSFIEGKGLADNLTLAPSSVFFKEPF